MFRPVEVRWYFILMDSSPAYYLIRGLLTFSAGIYFLRGAPLLVGLAYSAKDEDEDDKETISD